MLGCSPTARDSIEHYACCRFVREAASAHLSLQLRPPPDAASDFLLVSIPPEQPHPQSTLLRMALFVYTTYTVTNNVRHNMTTAASSLLAPGMLHQAILQAAMGHCRAEAVMRDFGSFVRAVCKRCA